MCFFVNENTLELPVPFSPVKLFRNIVEFSAKNKFPEVRTTNIIQLFTAIKGSFLDYFFSPEHVTAKENSAEKFPGNYLKNVAKVAIYTSLK